MLRNNMNILYMTQLFKATNSGTISHAVFYLLLL